MDNANITVRMDSTNEILSRRRMQPNGEAQVYLTQECAKAFNNYVPFDTGRLKDGMVTLQASSIHYQAPYARKQYYTNHGKGKQGTSLGGLRGARWDRRCWASKGKEIVKNVAKFCGGSTR